MLTAEKVRDLFCYDPETGALTWRVTRGSNAPAGRVAGYLSKKKNRYAVEVDGKQHFAHRLIWLHVYGRWPNGQIDHIDGDGSNNRLSNLREVTNLVNQQNKRRARADSKTGVLGVYSVSGKFRATIQSGRKTTHLGLFKTPEDAQLAYVSAKRRMHEGCTI